MLSIFIFNLLDSFNLILPSFLIFLAIFFQFLYFFFLNPQFFNHIPDFIVILNIVRHFVKGFPLVHILLLKELNSLVNLWLLLNSILHSLLQIEEPFRPLKVVQFLLQLSDLIFVCLDLLLRILDLLFSYCQISVTYILTSQKMRRVHFLFQFVLAGDDLLRIRFFDCFLDDLIEFLNFVPQLDVNRFKFVNLHAVYTQCEQIKMLHDLTLFRLSFLFQPVRSSPSPTFLGAS